MNYEDLNLPNKSSVRLIFVDPEKTAVEFDHYDGFSHVVLDEITGDEITLACATIQGMSGRFFWLQTWSDGSASLSKVDDQGYYQKIHPELFV